MSVNAVVQNKKNNYVDLSNEDDPGQIELSLAIESRQGFGIMIVRVDKC